MPTSEELLINWARGEWQIGDDPRPLPPRVCLSFEKNYRPEPGDWPEPPDGEALPVVEDDLAPPVNWQHHAIVSDFFKRQDWLVRRILINEYVDRFHKYRGLTRNERRAIIARKFNLNKKTIFIVLEAAKMRLSTFFRGN